MLDALTAAEVEVIKVDVVDEVEDGLGRAVIVTAGSVMVITEFAADEEEVTTAGGAVDVVSVTNVAAEVVAAFGPWALIATRAMVRAAVRTYICCFIPRPDDV